MSEKIDFFSFQGRSSYFNFVPQACINFSIFIIALSRKLLWSQYSGVQKVNFIAFLVSFIIVVLPMKSKMLCMCFGSSKYAYMYIVSVDLN